MRSPRTEPPPKPLIRVVEESLSESGDRLVFNLRRDFECSTDAIQSYAFAKWQPVIFDCMVVAAAVEYADRVVKRPASSWMRQVGIQIPVNELSLWSSSQVKSALRIAVEFLTGDFFDIEFVQYRGPVPRPQQPFLELPKTTQAVLPYSDGLDSRAVARILGETLGDELVRVRIGSKKWDREKTISGYEPFAVVPYRVACNMPNRELSSRSRGFRFALIGAVAAYLTDADKIIMPESGQGIFGPALIQVANGYPDYRSHPLFATKMEDFVEALFGTKIRYVFPRIWHTKGQTLREFADIAKDDDWQATRSCWKSSRWCSVRGKRRQCGICAACMLRRLSVHAAGLTEPLDTYVCFDLKAEALERAIDPDFKRLSASFRKYAVAGVLHMDHLAELTQEDDNSVLDMHASLLGHSIDLPTPEIKNRISTLFNQHAVEWGNFMDSLGERSFVKKWARYGI